MNSHNITNESLALALMLVVVAILISHKEKLALEKDILWSVGRAIIQLRSEERRVGKECTSWCRSRWSPYH